MNRLKQIALSSTALALLGTPLLAGGTALTTERVASGLTRPVYVTAPVGDFDRLFIVEQRSGSTGRIRVLNLDTNTLLPTPFLSVSGVSTGNEQGLLGMAFDPDYANNGFFYVNYTSANRTFIERYTVSAGNPNVADASSAFAIWDWSQPFSNHNGGWMDFGPDGYLYIGTGDGGSGNDPGNRAQDITVQRLGKMLRLDVSGVDDFINDPGRNYHNPADNPFVGVSGDDEIWAYGLRNPWRCGFDRVTGELYIADVGQNAWEEIDVQPAGAGGLNYGWRCMEGNNCTSLSGCVCSAASLTDPIQVYSHGSGCSVTGGYVYRGCAIPDLQGTYFYADFCSSTIWSLRYSGGSVSDFEVRTAELDPPSFSITGISSFGEDASGEMYICDIGGEIFKIIPVGGAPGGDDVNGNGIVDACESLGSGYCYGDGTGNPCPCVNTGGTGKGCKTSENDGMTISAVGSPSIGADDMWLIANEVPLSNTGIFFAATGSFGNGNPLFDGLQCAGGNSLRFQGQFASTAQVTQTNLVASDLFGLFWNAGTTYYFQYFTRDNQNGASPCSGFANLSHGLSVVMAP